MQATYRSALNLVTFRAASAQRGPRACLLGRRCFATARAFGDDGVAVEFEDGVEQRYHWLWLRDNCLHESQITANGQRLFETADLVRAHKAEGTAYPASFELRPDGPHLRVEWKDGHVSRFPTAWLRANAYDKPDLSCSSVAAAASSLHGSFLWNARLRAFLPEVTFRDLQTEQGKVRLSWLCERFGFALIRGVPVEAGMVEVVGNMLGHVRRTNYGAIFDVVDKGASAENLAYTTASITQHTDNPYRDPVPGVQLLHCLRAAAGPGGETLLVDGFAAAERLRAGAPDAFELLARHPRAYRYMDALRGTDLRTDSFPAIELDSTSGAVLRLRFNNRSAAPLRAAFGETLAYYEAWARFQGVLQDPELLLPIKLAPGDLLLFQNHRVLHGRSGYQAGEPRHLQGAYMDVDALRSRLHAAEASAGFAASAACPLRAAAARARAALRPGAASRGAARAQAPGATDEDILVALFHDVGRAPQAASEVRGEGELLAEAALVGRSDGGEDEGALGAQFLEGLGFGERVVGAVRLQTQARRHSLASRAAGSSEEGSPSAGTASSPEPGVEPLSPEACAAFEQAPGAGLAIEFCAWHVRWKEDPGQGPSEDHTFDELMVRHLGGRASAV